jgi:hypothetical protein
MGCLFGGGYFFFLFALSSGDWRKRGLQLAPNGGWGGCKQMAYYGYPFYSRQFTMCLILFRTLKHRSYD